jgi:hypothetical protein
MQIANLAYIAIRNDGVAGNGSVENPYDGSTAVLLDGVLRGLAANTTIIFGPGLFRTRGGAGEGYLLPANVGWKPQTGWQMRGSGIHSTILQFIWDLHLDSEQTIQRHKMIFSAEYLSSFQIEGLTLDCNLQNTPFEATRKFTVTAAAITGDNVRFRRIRVINFGTRTPLENNGQFVIGAEGFPLRIEGRTLNVTSGGAAADKPSFNSWMEECIIEQPYPSPSREVTFVVGGGIGAAVPPNPLHLQPFGCGMRKCYMNFEFTNPRPGYPVPIDSISYSGTAPNVTATVTTRFSHNTNLAAKDYVEFIGSSDPAFANQGLVAKFGV